MKRAISWLWNTGILSTFLAGLLAILPLAITVAIMGWFGRLLQDWLGPETIVGRGLRQVGLQFVTDDTAATIVGWVGVLAAIWVLGLLVRSATRGQATVAFDAAMNRIPVVKSIYRPVAQVVEMFKKDDKDAVAGMPVVYCRFGADHGAGVLGLLASPRTFNFGGQACRLVYVPTSPLPMSGGLLFLPERSVSIVDMPVDALMQVYFSLGVMAGKVVPDGLNVAGHEHDPLGGAAAT